MSKIYKIPKDITKLISKMICNSDIDIDISRIIYEKNTIVTYDWHSGGCVNWGKKVSITIPHYGTIISNMRYVIDPNHNLNHNPNPDLGLKGWYDAILQVQLEIGGFTQECYSGSQLREIAQSKPILKNGCIVLPLSFKMLIPSLLIHKHKHEIKLNIAFISNSNPIDNINGWMLLDHEGLKVAYGSRQYPEWMLN